MRTELCDRFSIDHPIFAFIPSEHVAAAVSRAGGLGVLGAVRFNDPTEGKSVDVIEQAHAKGVQVAALAGAAKHALSHVQNGVDIIVAQGYEAGVHPGEIASMVLTPEAVDAIGPDVADHRGVPEPDHEQGHDRGVPARRELRHRPHRVYTGKPARLLKTKWTEAWVEEAAPPGCRCSTCSWPTCTTG